MVHGRAWSGLARVASVEVSVDGGETWQVAGLEHDVESPWAWSAWTYEWDAPLGRHELCVRARDEAGNEQPLDGEWNVGGYGNNAVQRLIVNVS